MSFLFHPRNAAYFHPANTFFYPGAAACAPGACGPRAYSAPRRAGFDSFLNDPFEEFFNDDYLFPRVKFARFIGDDRNDDAMDCSDGTCTTGYSNNSCDTPTSFREATPLRETKGGKKEVLKSSGAKETPAPDNKSENRLTSFGGFGELFSAPSLFGNQGLKFDVKETDESLSISSQLQGFDKNDLKVDFEHGNLVISAEKKLEHKDERTGAVSRSFKSFSRAFALPENIDKEGIRAKYRDDESRLTIEVPKTKPAEKPSKETIVIN